MEVQNHVTECGSDQLFPQKKSNTSTVFLRLIFTIKSMLFVSQKIVFKVKGWDSKNQYRTFRHQKKTVPFKVSLMSSRFRMSY